MSRRIVVCEGPDDFVAANPPFNQNAVDKDRIKDDKKRFPFGMPSTDNASTLWIQLFYSALGPAGRAGFVMANSASDARGSELEIRKKLIETGAVARLSHSLLAPLRPCAAGAPLSLSLVIMGSISPRRRDAPA